LKPWQSDDTRRKRLRLDDASETLCGVVAMWRRLRRSVVVVVVEHA